MVLGYGMSDQPSWVMCDIAKKGRIGNRCRGDAGIRRAGWDEVTGGDWKRRQRKNDAILGSVGSPVTVAAATG